MSGTFTSGGTTFTTTWDKGNTTGTHFIITTTTTSNSPYVKTFQKDLQTEEGATRIDSDGSTWIFLAGKWHKLFDQFIIKEII